MWPSPPPVNVIVVPFDAPLLVYISQGLISVLVLFATVEFQPVSVKAPTYQVFALFQPFLTVNFA